MPFGLGFGELLLIFAVLLMLFGAKRLPEVASGMGKGIRDFKRALNGVDDESLQAGQAPAQQVAPAAAPAAPQVQATAAPAEVKPAEQ
ncbi:MAG TPA: twin-arginine translocase TatA/TatE family subunit [Longimicrobiaceae bacterium]|nr:twin-arginine translocase TatA/TatE family subunit [Longimicrobiaceae bacterium]